MADILLIGPQRERAAGLRSLLREDGHAVRWLRQPEQWRDAERERPPELVVAAVESAETVMRAARGRGRGFPAPLLLVQNDAEFGHDPHLDDRLVDRLESPFMIEELLARVDALVRVRRVILRAEIESRPRRGDDAPEESSRGRLRSFGHRLGALLGSRVPRHHKPLGPYLEVAARVAEWADLRDGFEPGHAERVANFCGMIADGLDLSDADASSVLRAAMLHDIGKVALPVEILTRPGPLADDQMRLVRTHPERGAAILRALDADDDIARAILYHHERVDGSGYYGKRGEEVPQASLILAVAEACDAMTHSRVRPTVPQNAALERLEKVRGTWFDESCVDALARALRPRRRTVPLSSFGV